MGLCVAREVVPCRTGAGGSLRASGQVAADLHAELSTTRDCPQICARGRPPARSGPAALDSDHRANPYPGTAPHARPAGPLPVNTASAPRIARPARAPYLRPRLPSRSPPHPAPRSPLLDSVLPAPCCSPRAAPRPAPPPPPPPSPPPTPTSSPCVDRVARFPWPLARTAFGAAAVPGAQHAVRARAPGRRPCRHARRAGAGRGHRSGAVRRSSSRASPVSIEHAGGLRTTYEPVRPTVRMGQ